MHAMEKKARAATTFVAMRSESSGCVGVAHAALARVLERRAWRGTGRTSASSRWRTATTGVAAKRSTVARMIRGVHALEQLGQHRSQHHPFTDADSPTRTRSAAPPWCPVRTTPRRRYSCWSPTRHGPHILFFMFYPALPASCSVACRCSLKCFSSCPVDDGRLRHRAIEDAGMKKSLQLWINLTCNGQVLCFL
nr:uncharacterized protein LOC127330209 [Lolium perenne]